MSQDDAKLLADWRFVRGLFADTLCRPLLGSPPFGHDSHEKHPPQYPP